MSNEATAEAAGAAPPDVARPAPPETETARPAPPEVARLAPPETARLAPPEVARPAVPEAAPPAPSGTSAAAAPEGPPPALAEMASATPSNGPGETATALAENRISPRLDPVLRELLVTKTVVRGRGSDDRRWVFTPAAERRLDQLERSVPDPAKVALYFGHRCAVCGEFRATRRVDQDLVCDACRDGSA